MKNEDAFNYMKHEKMIEYQINIWVKERQVWGDKWSNVNKPVVVKSGLNAKTILKEVEELIHKHKFA